MRPLNQKLLRDMKSLKFQILSMSILVACGTAILTASWSAYNSLFQAKELYYQNNQFADIFVDVVRAPHTTLEKIRTVPGVQHLEDRITTDGIIDLKTQTEPALARVISIYPQMVINKIHLREGRWPSSFGTYEVLIHESFAKAHSLKAGDHFALTIKSQKHSVRVAGIAISPEYIYALSSFAPFPDDKHFGVIWMLKNDLEAITGLTGAFNNVVIKADDKNLLPQMKQNINQILGPFGTVGAYGRDLQISHIFIQDEIRQQKSMSYVVPAIFISVAVFILHTVLHRLIHMHRGQIATLKSLGYSSLSISLHYWKLVSVILILGLLPGFLLAYGIGQWYLILYRQFYRFPVIDFNISRNAFLIGVAASIIPGWAVTFFSLRNIFQLQPAEAMRPAVSLEPSRFRDYTVKEFSRKSTMSTMLFRNILFRPIRSVLSVVGLSAAVAILINGSFWSDVINYVVNKQFREANREDMEVRFLHPRKNDIAFELSRIPGIELVEVARIVGVNLVFRNIRKSTVLIGTEDSVLRRQLDRKKKSIVWDKSTVLLSRYFRDQYDLNVGDKVLLELTDKTHAPFTVTIGGFTEDLVGASLYADKLQLHQWLQEAPCADTAYLRIDPTQAISIYLRLKNSPEVIAVQVKKLLFESFNRILSSMIKTFTMILFSFAVIITIAVLFNISRISLSERSWEFASLKIMGFHDFEVFHLIYAEIGILIVCALLPGFALGYFLSFLSTHLIHSETLSFPLVVEPQTYAMAAVSLIFSYLLIGGFLYRNIVRVSMTDALKARE